MRALFVLPLCLLFSILGPVNPAVAAESSGPFVVLIGPPASGKTSSGNYISEQKARQKARDKKQETPTTSRMSYIVHGDIAL